MTGLKLDIAISENDRAAVARRLQLLLADEAVLSVKTRNFHWNVVGPRFQQAHELLGEQYDQLSGFIDEVAERIRQLGLPAAGSLTEFLAASRLKEAPGAEISDLDALRALAEDHQAVARALRADVAAADDKHGDAGTADFLTGLLAAHEKAAWILRSHLIKE